MRDPISTRTAPRSLSPTTKHWFRYVVDHWNLTQADLKILVAACQCWDRGEQARAVVDREGLTIETKSGRRAHPCVRIELEQKALFSKLVKDLHLDGAPAVNAPLPAALRALR